MSGGASLDCRSNLRRCNTTSILHKLINNNAVIMLDLTQVSRDYLLSAGLVRRINSYNLVDSAWPNQSPVKGVKSVGCSNCKDQTSPQFWQTKPFTHSVSDLVSQSDFFRPVESGEKFAEYTKTTPAEHAPSHTTSNRTIPCHTST